MDISINSLIEGANFSDACCSACHAAGAYHPIVKHAVWFLSPVFKVWCFCGIWEPGLLLMIPAGVVAVGVCPVSLPAAGGCDRACRAGRGVFQMRMPGHAPYAGSGRPAGPVCR